MRFTRCRTGLTALGTVALAIALSLSACKATGSTEGTGGSNGSGGSSSSGGSNGSGGSSNTGGSNGSGGSSNTGGSNGSGGSSGSTGSGGSATGAGGSSSGSATFNITITQSTAVATVEIVTWSVNVSIDSAVINFGRDQSNFEFQAPVDLTQSNYRTLLLGMKQNTKYYVQVVAQGGGKSYSSDVKNVMSGYLPNGLPTFKTTTTNGDTSPLYAGGGFTVNCFSI